MSPLLRRLSIQRIKILREKREALAKAARREIATLVERGKIEIARIKVENIMNDDLYIQLLEVLELYCEILEARFGLLDSRCGTTRNVQGTTYLTFY